MYFVQFSCVRVEISSEPAEELSREVVSDAGAGRVPDGIAVLKGKSKPLGAAMEAAAAEVARQERDWVTHAMELVNRRAENARVVQLVSLLAQLAARRVRNWWNLGQA